jgi:MFS family permease
MSAFFCGYLPMQIGGALLCRRYGGKAVLTYGALLWSGFTALTPYAASLGFWVLIACRVAMGLSEGVAFPAMFHYLASWVPEAERGRSVSTFLVGVYLGTTVALVVSPKIIAWHSWHMVFYSFGVAGGIWILFWVLLARDRNVSEDDAAANGIDLQDEASQDGISLTRFSSSSSDFSDDGELSSGNLTTVDLLPRDPAFIATPARRYSGCTGRIISPAEAQAFRFILTNRSCLALCCVQFCVSFSHCTSLDAADYVQRSGEHVAKPRAVLELTDKSIFLACCDPPIALWHC